MINRRALPDARKIGRGPCGSLVSHIRQALISRRRRGKDTRRTLQITVSNMWWTKEALQVANNRRRSIALVPAGRETSASSSRQCYCRAGWRRRHAVGQLPTTKSYPVNFFQLIRSSISRRNVVVKAGSSIASSTSAGRTRGTSTSTRSAVSQANDASMEHNGAREAAKGVETISRAILASILIHPENCI